MQIIRSKSLVLNRGKLLFENFNIYAKWKNTSLKILANEQNYQPMNNTDYTKIPYKCKRGHKPLQSYQHTASCIRTQLEKKLNGDEEQGK